MRFQGGVIKNRNKPRLWGEERLVKDFGTKGERGTSTLLPARSWVPIETGFSWGRKKVCLHFFQSPQSLLPPPAFSSCCPHTKLHFPTNDHVPPTIPKNDIDCQYYGNVALNRKGVEKYTIQNMFKCNMPGSLSVCPFVVFCRFQCKVLLRFLSLLVMWLTGLVGKPACWNGWVLGCCCAMPPHTLHTTNGLAGWHLHHLTSA